MSYLCEENNQIRTRKRMKYQNQAMSQNRQVLEDPEGIEVENEHDTCGLSIIDPLKTENRD